ALFFCRGMRVWVPPFKYHAHARLVVSMFPLWSKHGHASVNHGTLPAARCLLPAARYPYSFRYLIFRSAAVVHQLAMPSGFEGSTSKRIESVCSPRSKLTTFSLPTQ